MDKEDKKTLFPSIVKSLDDFYMRKREISLEIKLWQWVQWF